jgi:dihydroorotate dehydrogenase (NAD+) catalytic subunit
MLDVEFCGLTLASPVLIASGTGNYGREISDFGNLSQLGAVIGKTITPKERLGNPMPRFVETASGMINSIGLENVGVKRFLREVAPAFLALPCHSIVNIAGFTVSEYGDMARQVTGRGFDMIEVNGSCPNVEAGGRVFCFDGESAYRVVRQVKENATEPVMMKLSPNVGDIVEVAQAAVEAGADALSLINTLVGTAVNWKTLTRGTAFGTGGLSGPAVKPVALHLVDKVCSAVNIPVCAIGGISSVDDVCEFLALGATCVQIGSAQFRDPALTFKIIEKLSPVLQQNGYQHVQELIGALRRREALKGNGVC